MVERLKAAIEKAREQRNAMSGLAAGAVSAPPAGHVAASPPAWSGLEAFAPDAAHLHANRIVTFRKTDPAHVAFDVLRTRLLRVCRENGWRRIGVTSPTKGCGKSMVCLNLAFSLVRNAECRTILADLDLKLPALAKVLNVRSAHEIADLLSGRISPQDFLVRIGDNLAVAVNTRSIDHGAEVVQSAAAAGVLRRMAEDYDPTVILYDLPPLLANDITLGFLGNVDGVLLVAAAGQSTAAQITECERLLGGSNLLGVVLNKSEEASMSGYEQAYDEAAV